MIKVTLEFENTDALVAYFSRPQITVTPTVVTNPTVEITTPAVKRGRKPKETPATNLLPGATGAGNGDSQATVEANGASTTPEHTPPAAGAAPTPAAPAAAGLGEAVTIEQARAAMNEVMQSFGDNGLEKVAEILNGIGFQRISEVTADKYPLVVERCKAMLAAKNG